jgi:hypothetical protein
VDINHNEMFGNLNCQDMHLHLVMRTRVLFDLTSLFERYHGSTDGGGDPNCGKYYDNAADDYAFGCLCNGSGRKDLSVCPSQQKHM